jgi:hypothetical protein
MQNQRVVLEMHKYMGAEERDPVPIPFCLIGGKTGDFKGNYES